MRKTHVAFVGVFFAGLASSQAAIVWELGQPGRGWPLDGVGGGADVDFVQEAGTNALPGDPNSPAAAQQADDDYYFAGVYSTILDGGTYTPVGVVANDEIAAERAFAGADNSLRVHFNLGNIAQDDLLTVSFEPFNLHIDAATIPDPRYGIEIYFNGTLVMPEQIIRPADLNTVFTSPSFSLGDVGAELGSGFDNYVELRGVNYGADGGGNWMGVDYTALNADPIPEPASPLLIIVASTAGLVVLRRRRRC